MDKNIWIWTFTAISVNCTVHSSYNHSFFLSPKMLHYFCIFFPLSFRHVCKIVYCSYDTTRVAFNNNRVVNFLKILMYSLNLVKGGYLQLASAVRRKYSFCRRSLHNSSITSLQGCQFQLINYGIASL